MNLIKNFVTGLTLALTVTVAVTVATTPLLAQNSTVLALPGVQKLGYEDPIINAKTAPAGIPSTVAISTLGSFTNLQARVVRGSDVAFTLWGRSQITNATASNQVLFAELSPDGKLWASTSPLRLSFTPVLSNEFKIEWLVAATNFAANSYVRLMGLTNNGSTGNGSVFLTQAVISTWSPLPNPQVR